MSARTFDIVVLSSSPPIAPECAPSSPLNASSYASPRRVHMSSIPLPALSPPVSPLKKTLGASTILSKKAIIPPGANRGFATVGSLIRSEHFAQHLDEPSIAIKEAQARRISTEDMGETTHTLAKKPRKRSARPIAPDDGANPKPKPRARKPKANKDNPTDDPQQQLPVPKISPYFAHEDAEPSGQPQTDPTIAAPKLTKSGKPRKPRAKKEVDIGDTEPKPKKARVAKPKAAAKAVGKAQREDAGVEFARKATDTARRHETATLDVARDQVADAEEVSIWEVPQSLRPKKKRLSKQPPPDAVADGLELEEAVLRRRDWTPPRDTTGASPFTDSIGKENKQSEPFTHMVSNFAYAQAPLTAPSTTETMAATKRRRVELVDVPGNQTYSRQSSPEKSKAPKKKPRTITDIATEQYQPQNLIVESLGISSNFFEPKTSVTKVALNDIAAPNNEVQPKKPARKRSVAKDGAEKAGSKAKARKMSTKSTGKPKTIAEKLLSPASALLRLNKQDVLFGTSSQLALEESPTMLRQIQLAIKESEQDDTSFGHSLMPPPQWPTLKKAIGGRSLWDASSRDDAGGMLEQLEDVYIPEFDRTQDFPLLMDGTDDVPDATEPDFVDIDDLEPPGAAVIWSDLPTPPHPTTRHSQAIETIEKETHNYILEDSMFEDIDDFDLRPPPSNQEAQSQYSFVDIDNLDLPPSPQLSTLPPPKPRPPAPAFASGSPKKRRGRPPKAQSVGPTTAHSPHPVLKPPPSRLKPKKSVSAPHVSTPKGPGRFIDIDEILDSEDEAMQALSPTPPRIRKFPDSEPLPLYLAPSSKPSKPKPSTVSDATMIPIHRIPMSNLIWDTIKSFIFPRIIAHVRSILPTTDPKSPTWHERILMYEPVVLEDFTAYLNANTDIRTYRKATQKQIKAWNADRKAAGEETVDVLEWEDKVLAVERELEASQVREWCESMSVCCIWGEGRGKVGTARQGYY